MFSKKEEDQTNYNFDKLKKLINKKEEETQP